MLEEYPFLLSENLQILGQVISVLSPFVVVYIRDDCILLLSVLLAQMVEVCLVDVKSVIDESYRCHHDATW